MNSIAKLNGLVLAGGESRRMGTDKGLLQYHNKPQRLYIYNLLDEFCENVYVSIRPDQQKEFESNIPYIVDQNIYSGPFNGLMSAYSKDPNKAWLVLACDMPMVDRDAIVRLVNKRATSQKATVYKAIDKDSPEPLFAIWEPEGLRAAQDYLKNGHSCSPLRFLAESNVAIVNPFSDEILLNVNHTKDYQKVLKKIKKKSE